MKIFFRKNQKVIKQEKKEKRKKSEMKIFKRQRCRIFLNIFFSVFIFVSHTQIFIQHLSWHLFILGVVRRLLLVTCVCVVWEKLSHDTASQWDFLKKEYLHRVHSKCKLNFYLNHVRMFVNDDDDQDYTYDVACNADARIFCSFINKSHIHRLTAGESHCPYCTNQILIE